MKKTYILPETMAIEIQTQQLVAMSLQSGQALKDQPVLSKEDEDMWDIWEEEDYTIK